MNSKVNVVEINGIYFDGEEILTPIPSHKGFSNYLVNAETGQIWNKLKQRYLQVNPNSNDYVYATLIADNGEYARLGAHRVVASSIYGMPIELFKRGGIEVDHFPLEDQKWNNSRNNIRITDRKGQYRESTKEKMGKGKRLKEEQVVKILEQLKEWKEDEENKISDFIWQKVEETGQGYRNIFNIVTGRSWRHLHDGVDA